eukprot:CAMPEP_0201898904 /NCGR_PEP_ID=MMETSP0902-20130614/49400_1 /ASSEMBLY_ACC=CAM_ASM_000551 /TAXON_ID=420261 /ORGANISM="Thalassiosira antarctica, Strain CCMP982" /LENGTH=75 /DNA_ID=CAMNT_0048432177 /DNA_START=171 /DNA_END=395 /DNA_ORIENTATION=-
MSGVLPHSFQIMQNTTSQYLLLQIGFRTLRRRKDICGIVKLVFGPFNGKFDNGIRFQLGKVWHGDAHDYECDGFD